MKIDLNRYEKAFAALPDQVREAEVCADLREELLISVRNGQQDRGESFSRTTLYLRASGEKTGTVLTEKLDEDPYHLMEQALEGAAYSQAETAELMNSRDSFFSISGDDSAEAPALREAACALEREAKHLRNVEKISECSIRKTIFARRVLNSKGLDSYLEHSAYLVSLTLQVQGQEGTAEQYVSSLKDVDIPSLAQCAEERAITKRGDLPKMTLPSGTYSAVLSSDVVRNMMIAIWQCFSGERLRSGASPFAKEGIIASSCLNIVDDPLPGNWSVDYRLDSQGSLCRKKDIVRKGKLVQGLHTLSTDPWGGNAGRIATLTGTTPIAVIPIPSCIYVEPGEESPEELLAQMGDGIHLTYSLDVFHSINIASGEFSIPCGGVLYKKGKAIGRVEQLTIAGNLRNLFQNVLAVGNDLSLEEFMFYHNYSYGGPSILVKDLSFSGKE